MISRILYLIDPSINRKLVRVVVFLFCFCLGHYLVVIVLWEVNMCDIGVKHDPLHIKM